MAAIQPSISLDDLGDGASTQTNRRRWLIAIRSSLGDEAFADFIIEYLTANWSGTARNLKTLGELWSEHHGKTNMRRPQTNMVPCDQCEVLYIKRNRNQRFCTQTCCNRWWKVALKRRSSSVS